LKAAKALLVELGA
jgi:hypothetical protein